MRRATEARTLGEVEGVEGGQHFSSRTAIYPIMHGERKANSEKVPNVQKWGLCLQPYTMQSDLHLPENTEIDKFAIGIMCSSWGRAGSH